MAIDDSQKISTFTRRAFILGTMKVSIFSILFGRMFYLQIIKSDQYKTLSENNRIKISIISPMRGEIMDRHGNLLAANKKHYKVIFDKAISYKDIKKSISVLSQLLKLPEDDEVLLLQKIKESAAEAQVVLFQHVSWADITRIEENSSEMPGVYIDIGYVRYYPYSTLCSHIIGYVGSAAEDDLSNSKDLFANHPDIKVGKNGLEKTFDEELKGKAGFRKLEVNAKGKILRELSAVNSESGSGLAVTIDLNLQSFSSNILKNNGASVVLLDIATGDILVLCSTPSFDPNQFSFGISNENWGELINNPYLPLTNKCISMMYPPGSPFKLVTSLTALKLGLNPETKFLCPGFYELGSRKLQCWKKIGHGYLNLSDAIAQSCSTYMCNIAKNVGIDAIASTARILGLGNKFDLNLPRQNIGLVPDKKWKWSNYRKNWQLGDTMNCAIGQGYVLATPIQLAVMTARVASGNKVLPRLVFKKNNKFLPNFDFINIEKSYFDIVRTAMSKVVNDSHGTAFAGRINDTHFAMAGKTGTAQVISKRNPDEDLSKENVERKFRNHAIFVGYAPILHPRFAISVIVEHGGGASAAVPFARDILLEAQKTYLI